MRDTGEGGGRGEENERQRQLDSTVVGFGMRRDYGERAEASGKDREWREAEGMKSPEAASCLLFA